MCTAVSGGCWFTRESPEMFSVRIFTKMSLFILYIHHFQRKRVANLNTLDCVAVQSKYEVNCKVKWVLS